MIFAIEKTLPDFRYIEDEAERKRVLETIHASRDEQSRPLVEQLKTWMGQQRCLPKSKLGQAIRYAMNNWEGLCVFLDDSRAPMTNNQAERRIRPAVVGRKNHYCSKSRRQLRCQASMQKQTGKKRLPEKPV